MNDRVNAQTRGKREIIESLDRQFARLHVNSVNAIASLQSHVLYAVPRESSIPSSSSSLPSVGEGVLRSAAVVERTFGGITSNLWDDPFEWTLPEHLSTPESIKGYLEEVEATRQRAFSSFVSDDSLLKHIAMPSGNSQPLIGLLLETLVRAVELQSQALLVLKLFSGIGPRRFII